MKVLGLDIGTNSIGWALIDIDWNSHEGNIIKTGSRIIPMDAEMLSDYERGNKISKTASKRQAKGARRLKDRYKLRRGRLIDTLKLLGWIPETFDIDKGDKLMASSSSIAEMKALFKKDEYPIDDWVVYYLRQKALAQKIELSELALILYHLNQRRGFKSNRKTDPPKEEESGENTSKQKAVSVLEIVKVKSVVDTGERYKTNAIVFDVLLEDGRTGTFTKREKPDWEGKEIELLIKTVETKKETKTVFLLPDKSDWVKSKEALEKDINGTKLHIGEYFFTQLLKNPQYRIRERIIDRARYDRELMSIWEEQSKPENHPELKDTATLTHIATLLYKHNTAKQKQIAKGSLLTVFKDDIIYYQRPLKTKKSSIGECRYEKRTYIDANGKEIVQNVKSLPISAPLFQEFRIWQTIHNLKVFKKEGFANGRHEIDIDETDALITPDVKENLYALFDSHKEVSLSAIFKALNLKDKTHRLNYPDDTKFPGNTTKAAIRTVFAKHEYKEQGEDILSNPQKFELIWHILYSLAEEKDIEKAVKKHFGFSDELAKHISQMAPFKSGYGSYSAKATNKLLPLMRVGKCFSPDAIDPITKDRIEKITAGVYDKDINDRTREKLIEYRDISQFQGLPTWLACYVVYGRHSEEDERKYYESPAELKLLKQHSLRNPIVEQVTNETLQLVKDIWKQYGRPEEIHVELGRDLKKNADERKEIAKAQTQNRDDKKRIAELLKEVRGANPDSSVDVEKYRLWENQKYRSPYTNEGIELNDLYDQTKYEIEHIIPKAKYFDDSFANKVICESFINKDKGDKTAMQYLKDGSVKYKLQKPDDYIAYCKSIFRGKKLKSLLSEDVPNDFVMRQLNDTRYISTRVKSLLSPVVNQDNSEQKIIPITGEVTEEFRRHWGLADKMKEMLEPRFERLETITGESLVKREKDRGGKVKLHLKGYEKRIDHRHHALDALVIACVSRRHTQYLNTLSGKSEKDKEALEYDYSNIARRKREYEKPWPSFVHDAMKALSETVVTFKKNDRILTKAKNKYWKYEKQANGDWKKVLTKQTKGEMIAARKSLHKETLSGTISIREYKDVSLKDALKQPQNIADKATRKIVFTALKENQGDIKKTEKHFAENPISETSKVKIFYDKKYATSRTALDETFDERKIKEKIIDKVLSKQLLEHLAQYPSSKEAFSAEGIEQFNKTRKLPVYKVKIYEEVGNKFAIRTHPSGKEALVEAGKGTNLYFVIYRNIETGARVIDNNSTIPYRDVLACKAKGTPIAESRQGYQWMSLSPNDLVYVPDPDEDMSKINWEQKQDSLSSKIYKVVSSTGSRCYFVPHTISKMIKDKVEYTQLNKVESVPDKTEVKRQRSIKEICVKLEVDRLGNIKPAQWND